MTAFAPCFFGVFGRVLPEFAFFEFFFRGVVDILERDIVEGIVVDVTVVFGFLLK